jgi:YHS domain-containing protein
MKRDALLVLVVAGALAACGAATTPQQAGTVQLTEAQVASKLAAADAADGHVDKVVAKCASCRLGMDGDPQYTSVHAGYTLHFCSPECKQRFDADPLKVIAKLPEKPQA